MIIENTKLEGVLLLKPRVFKDDRGYFFEAYSQKTLKENGLDLNFVQDNISRSSFGTVRGLHYQVGANAQGKLVQAVKGTVLDVAVDIRVNSPTFGQHVAVELSGENNFQLWIPPGFAHGFSVLSEEAYFHYKCTALYSKQDERAIRFDDPDLNINWQVPEIIMSEKDKLAGRFKDIAPDFYYSGDTFQAAVKE
ncbi:MAG: dTDP-4-dehydrorhamnose 3,5-epimerase [Syntrophothermus sp.]